MRLASYVACAAIALWARPESNPANPPCRLVLLNRQITQHQSRWIVQYLVRYDADEPLELSASDVAVDYAAWVSNSRSKPHTTPRKSQAHFELSESSSVQATIIASENDRHRCRERINLALGTSEKLPTEPAGAKTNFLPLRVATGQTFWISLTLEHEHFLYGTYDPLLGSRQLEVRLGPCRFIDTIPLDVECTSSTPAVKLSTPPKERLDTRQFRSAPDSLYLAADVPGYQYFRFDDMPVRYATEFKLSFWYLIAVGTEGSCHVRVMEYQDTPNAWCRLDGGFDERINAQGRWRRFEQVFQTRDETTTMALDFRIVGANIGEMWVDDIELVPRFSQLD